MRSGFERGAMKCLQKLGLEPRMFSVRARENERACEERQRAHTLERARERGMSEGNPKTRVATMRQSTEPEDFAHRCVCSKP